MAVRARERDFMPDAFVLDGLDFARDRFPELSEQKGLVAVWIHAMLVAVRPGDPECDRWEALAYESAQHDGALELRLAWGMTAAARRIWHGTSFEEFARRADELDTMARSDPACRLPVTAWLAARIHCGLLYPSDSAAVAPMLAEAIRHAIQAGMDPDETPLGSAAAIQDLVYGRLDEARAYFHRMAGFAGLLAPYDAWLHSFYKIWLHLAIRDADAAVLEAGRGLAYARQSGVPHALAWAKLAYARAVGGTSRARGAWARIAEARVEARRVGIDLLMLLSRLVAALVAMDRGRSARAAVLASAALAGLGRRGMLRPPLFVPEDLQRLVRCTRAASAHPDLMPAVTRFYGIDHQDRDREALSAAPLEVRCLGAFTLTRSGRVLAWPRKAPRRPLELLKATIGYGAEGAPVAELVEALWPGMDGDRAHRAFTSALYRLRALLGEKTLLLNAGRLKLNRDLVWVDVFAFEDAAATGGGAIENSQNLLAIYGGPFLAEHADLSWTTAARERLRERYRSAASRAAEALLAAGAWRGALDLLDDALERDASAEVFYQGAIAACLQGGLRAEAATYYQRCRTNLGEQLGVAPSAKTESLYRAVLRAAR